LLSANKRVWMITNAPVLTGISAGLRGENVGRVDRGLETEMKIHRPASLITTSTETALEVGLISAY